MALEVMTIRDVAQTLQLAEKTVYTMAAAGELPAFKVRGQWRIRGVDLESWLAAKADARAPLSGPGAEPGEEGEQGNGHGGLPGSWYRRCRLVFSWRCYHLYEVETIIHS